MTIVPISRRGVIAMLAAIPLWAPPSGCSLSQRAERSNGVALDLSALEARHGGRLGAFALDSGNGRQAAWRADERFAYCSTFKLFLAAAVLERIGKGEGRLDRRIAVKPSDIIVHAPVTGPAAGADLTVAELLRAMVEVSDNPAANILIREIGGLDMWRSWYRAFGDKVTRVDRLEPELNLAATGDPRDTTTPRQTVANLVSLFSGAVLKAEHRDLLLNWLIASPTGTGRIKAGVPDGAVVAHKTGTGFDGIANDIGLVTIANQAPIYLALYFSEAPDATGAERDKVVADATQALLGALARL